MVRRKIEIKPIQEKSKRHTTFTKRRQGLFKKVQDLVLLCDDEIAAITFSKAGNLYAWGHPSVDEIINRYQAYPLLLENGESELVDEDEENLPVLSDAKKKVVEVIAEEKPDYVSVMGNLGVDELSELELEMEKMKRIVTVRARQLAASGGNFSD